MSYTLRITGSPTDQQEKSPLMSSLKSLLFKGQITLFSERNTHFSFLSSMMSCVAEMKSCSNSPGPNCPEDCWLADAVSACNIPRPQPHREPVRPKPCNTTAGVGPLPANSQQLSQGFLQKSVSTSQLHIQRLIGSMTVDSPRGLMDCWFTSVDCFFSKKLS